MNTKIIVIIIALALLVTGSVITYSNFNNSNRRAIEASSPETIADKNDESGQHEVKRNELLESNIMGGGVPKDGIPPIEKPLFIGIGEADSYMRDQDQVFVLETENGIKLYPQNILVWHEIVNDVVDGENISVTYCPLTGSAIGYKCNFSPVPTTLGVSGKLLNSNLVMYDRDSDTYWPQILGQGINNKYEDNTLETLPVLWTSWEKAKAAYPEALVLSTETGFIRDYEKDPYGSYVEESSRSYYHSDSLMFPVMNSNTLYANKKVIVGVKGESSVVAIDPIYVKKERVVNTLVGVEPIVAFYDDSLGSVRVYRRMLNGEMTEFEIRDGKIFDNMHNHQWNVKGEVVSLPNAGQKLEDINSFDVMWFAWFAFYPDTEIVNGE